MSPAHLALQQAAFSAALLDPNRACPPGLRAWNGSDPTTRLAVYRNNVLSSLVDALADTFPVSQALVGEEFFRAMASVFVRQFPPRSPILAHYGAALPGFIASFEPAQAVPYLGDVARLEALRVRAFHAADAAPVTAAAVHLALASGERTGDLQLALHPSVGTMVSPYAVVSLWAAHQGAGEPGQVDVAPSEGAIVLREGLDVLVLSCPASAAAFVAAVQQGHNLGDAAVLGAVAATDFDLAATLGLLLAHGALTALHLPRRQDA